MSGIIGGAGSKSGVIGETELDYEEGTVVNPLRLGSSTVNTDTGGTWTSKTYVYTKIGKLVHVNVHIDTASLNLGTTGAISIHLPFVNRSGVGHRCYTLTKNYYGRWTEDVQYLLEGQAFINVYQFVAGNNFDFRGISSATERIHCALQFFYSID